MDFHSAEFNTYDSGVGALMQLSRNRGTGDSESGDITLFVSNIPTALTRVSVCATGGSLCVLLNKPCVYICTSEQHCSWSPQDGFRNLFSRAGKVKRVHIAKPNTPDKQTTYG